MNDTSITIKDTFWHHARCTHSYGRFDPCCRNARALFDLKHGKGKFRRLRRYRDPRTGEIRKTVEVVI